MTFNPRSRAAISLYATRTVRTMKRFVSIVAGRGSGGFLSWPRTVTRVVSEKIADDSPLRQRRLSAGAQDRGGIRIPGRVYATIVSRFMADYRAARNVPPRMYIRSRVKYIQLLAKVSTYSHRWVDFGESDRGQRNKHLRFVVSEIELHYSVVTGNILFHGFVINFQVFLFLYRYVWRFAIMCIAWLLQF